MFDLPSLLFVTGIVAGALLLSYPGESFRAVYQYFYLHEHGKNHENLKVVSDMCRLATTSNLLAGTAGVLIGLIVFRMPFGSAQHRGSIPFAHTTAPAPLLLRSCPSIAPCLDFAQAKTNE